MNFDNDIIIPKALYEEVAGSTNIINGKEYRQIIATVAQVASDMVVKTIGPYGATTLIDEGASYCYPSKDGLSALQMLHFNDPIYNTIFSMLRQVSLNAVSTSGDGTTSAMVGANLFLQEVMRKEKAFKNFRQADFIAAMEEASKNIIKQLYDDPALIHKISPDGDFEDIFKVANIALNGQENIAKEIQYLYQQTGNPNIHVMMDSGLEDVKAEVQNGYKIDAKPMSFPHYINNSSNTFARDIPTKVLIFDHNVTVHDHLQLVSTIMKVAEAEHTFAIIIAPYFDETIMSINNNQIRQCLNNKQTPYMMLMQLPITMDAQRLYLNDIAVLTDSTIINPTDVKIFNLYIWNATHSVEEQRDDPLLHYEQYQISSSQDFVNKYAGTIRNIVVDKNQCFIRDYETIAVPALYQATLDEAKKNYETLREKADRTLNGHLDRDYMEAYLRYVRFIGKTGVLKVGAVSSQQRRFVKDAIDDAVLACRAAYENGYVNGMNLSVINAVDTLIDRYQSNENENEYLLDCYRIFHNTFTGIALAVINNKWPDNTERRWVMEVQRGNDSSDLCSVRLIFTNEEVIDYCVKNHATYNLRTEMIETGNDINVINPVTTDVEIIKAITSILSLTMTSAQFLTTNQSYDPKLSRAKAMEQRITDERTIKGAVTDEILTRILNHPICDTLLDGLLNSVFSDIETEISIDDDEDNEPTVMN